MANSLAQRLGGLVGNIGNVLFGTQQTIPQQNVSQYPAAIQNYIDSLDNKPFFQDLINQPKQTALTPEQYKEGFAQGLNYGVPELAEAQRVLKINVPKTGEEIDQARQGLFNTYPTGGLVTGPRQGGILNDLASGYRDNYANSFNINNLQPQNKNLATRIGEGLGTVGRFVDSPLGRGLLAAGLNKALGYDNSLQEGLTAFVGRQNAQTADRVYRNQLMRDYGYTEDDLANIKGNIDATTFNNLTKSQYNAMNLALKQQTTQSMNKLRELQAKRLEIQNSNLPAQEKAKTLKMLAEAEHAEQMQLAKINYYTNAANNPLGWANYNLKADEAQRKAELDQLKKDIIKEFGGGENNKPPKTEKPKHKSNAF